MLLRSKLPLNRYNSGTLVVEDDDGSVILGPYPCRGKADNQDALAHSNPDRDPTRPYGDHPYGTYAVVAVQLDKQPARSYGSAFLLLDPQSGDALSAKKKGRTGLAIHGGDLGQGGSLRATQGCLRTTNTAVTLIAALQPVGWTYICEAE